MRSKPHRRDHLSIRTTLDDLPIVLDPKWLTAVPRHSLQYVYDGASNVFHLPAVNDRVQKMNSVTRRSVSKDKVSLKRYSSRRFE